MSDFAAAPVARDQLVLFPEKLDQVIPPDHAVRLVDEILSRINWAKWEALYNRRKGQPPIHPRVIAGAILYGILNRIRTSRGLEEALLVRNDFRWLVEGRSIDHTTFSKFRQKNSEALADLFVQIALVARDMGHLPLATLGFDGTRIKANNRKTGTRTPEELRQAKEQLAAKFKELEAKTAQADSIEQEQLGQANAHGLAQELADVRLRQKRVDAALAEIRRLEEDDQKVPARVPITDPQSRVMPNKEGGFAPNYNPTATVDVDSGIIVGAGVIANSDEDKHLVAAAEDVKESFHLDAVPAAMLADGLMSTGENLAACEAAGIDLYSPIKLGSAEDNPAIRENPSEPVAQQDIDRLPTTTTKHKDGTKSTRLNKEAFVYDTGRNSYWCPAGKELPYVHRTSETENGRLRIRYRYKSDASVCAACPLAARCLGRASKTRQIGHEQHEALRVAHAEKMSSEAAKQQYSRRRHPGERPFAVIKSVFGARQFLSRGLGRVGDEWLWLCGAFNLHRLLGLIASGTDPPSRAVAS